MKHQLVDALDDSGPPPVVPHETGGVLRMFQLGIPVPRIMQLLGKSRRQVQLELQLGLDDETEAGLDGRPIHNSGPKRVDTTEISAKDVCSGDYLIGHGFVERVWYSPQTQTCYQRQLIPGQATIALIDGKKLSFEPFTKLRVYVPPEYPAYDDGAVRKVSDPGFTTRFRRAYHASGLTLDEAAARLRTSAMFVTRWLEGRSAPSEYARESTIAGLEKP